MQALHDLGKEKGIAPEVIMEAVEAALISAYKKNFGATQNVQVAVDQVTGDFHVYTVYDVVETVENDKTEISLEDARKLLPTYEIGDVVTLLDEKDLSLDTWAEILGTINYELTCRLKARLPRVYTR